MYKEIEKLNSVDSILTNLESIYSFSICKKEEGDEVVDFLRKYWRGENYCLVKSRDLFDWQYFNKRTGTYNFVIARHKQRDEIDCIEGFIPVSMYDETNDTGYMWGSIWKTRDDIRTFGLGMAVLCYMNRIFSMSKWMAFGLSQFSISNYTSLGFECRNSEHYFLLNPTKQKFKLCGGVEAYINKDYTGDNSFSLNECSLEEYQNINSDNEMFNAYNSFKTKDFYVNRYFKHPWYEYKAYSISKEDVKAIIFTRECKAEGAKCLRIVDYVGRHDWLESVNEKLKGLLEQNNYEYIDLIIAGENPDVLNKAGFINKKIDENIIIPNYFEPFVKENVPMFYTYHKNCTSTVVYKADGDQDRPNFVIKRRL